MALAVEACPDEWVGGMAVRAVASTGGVQAQASGEEMLSKVSDGESDNNAIGIVRSSVCVHVQLCLINPTSAFALNPRKTLHLCSFLFKKSHFLFKIRLAAT